MILDEILAFKRQEVEAAKRQLPLEELRRCARPRPKQGRFKDALANSERKPALIAELKRKSPSSGMLRERFDPISLAQQLQDVGASALSILTDERFFGGSLQILRDVRQFVEIPVLRKDFVIDSYQIYEAAYHQADAVLLIAQVLTDKQLASYSEIASQLGMDALVEVHSEKDVERSLKVVAPIIGINQRDLKTFQLHKDITSRLAPKIPQTAVLVVESGLRTREDVKQLQALGAHAVLIGEALMTTADVAAKVRELFNGIW